MLALLTKVQLAASKTSVPIIPVVQVADIREASQFVKLDVWTQHTDAVDEGAHTGFILPEAAVADGAKGTFLNHSEHKFPDFAQLSLAHDRARKAGLKTLVFAAGMDELSKVVSLNPDFASYEPPELVGSKTTSVAEAKPEIISEAAKICQASSVPLIVGAGIKSGKDVKISISLGASGVAVASSIVLSADPQKEILELAGGYNK